MAKIQVSRREFHTHIHLDYTRIKFQSCIKKIKIKIKKNNNNNNNNNNKKYPVKKVLKISQIFKFFNYKPF